MGVSNCSMFCCTLLYVHSCIAIILMGKKELVALLNLSSWCFVTVEWLFLAVSWGFLRFVIVVFPDHTHLLFIKKHTFARAFVSRTAKEDCRWTIGPYLSQLYIAGVVIWPLKFTHN